MNSHLAPTIDTLRQTCVTVLSRHGEAAAADCARECTIVAVEPSVDDFEIEVFPEDRRVEMPAAIFTHQAVSLAVLIAASMQLRFVLAPYDGSRSLEGMYREWRDHSLRGYERTLVILESLASNTHPELRLTMGSLSNLFQTINSMRAYMRNLQAHRCPFRVRFETRHLDLLLEECDQIRPRFGGEDLSFALELESRLRSISQRDERIEAVHVPPLPVY